MKNKKIISIGLLLSLFVMVRACGQMTTKVSVKDEQGNPIEGAEVRFSYARPQGYESVSKLTNAEGLVKDTGKTNFHLNVRAEKAGFYKATYAKSNKGTNLEKNQNHDLTITLRKVVNPIALYAKKIEIQVPLLNQQIGFDMKVGDWVAPHGKGITKDFIVLATKDYLDGSNYSANIFVNFEGEYEGLKQDPIFSELVSKVSDFKTTRLAPGEKNYKRKKTFISQRSSENYRKGSTEITNFIFRSRVKLDDYGQIESCHYGKIINAFDVSKWSGKPDQNPVVKFTYYFNPTPNDRNLEFDPHKNLFKNLPYDQKVNQP